MELLGLAQPQVRPFRDEDAARLWFRTQFLMRHNCTSADDVVAALSALFSSVSHLTSSSGHRLHSLYYVQKKHDTKIGIAMLHHDINALVLVCIGDYD